MQSEPTTTLLPSRFNTVSRALQVPETVAQVGNWSREYPVIGPFAATVNPLSEVCEADFDGKAGNAAFAAPIGMKSIRAQKIKIAEARRFTMAVHFASLRDLSQAKPNRRK
ncbi:hypothetical protein GCM10009569_08980 [Arthrobacter russicus]